MAHTDDLVEGVLAKKVVGWLIAVGLALFFAAGMWASDVQGRLKSLEDGQFTREEAAGLRNAIDLLRAEIVYLRADMKRVEDRR